MAENENYVVEFCADCLEITLKQKIFNDVKECSNCGSGMYFRARMEPELAEEIMSFHHHRIDLGAITLLYGAAGLVEMEYVDVDPEPMSEEDIFGRIVEGISGEEGYTYDSQAFLHAIDAIEQRKTHIDESRSIKLLKVVSRLKRTILAEAL